MGYIILLLTLSLLDMQEALTVRLYSERKQVQQHFKQPLENPEGAIKNGQSRESGNITYIRRTNNWR